MLGGEDFISDRKVVRLVREYSNHLTNIILRGLYLVIREQASLKESMIS